jgi:hypothetical protein
MGSGTSGDATTVTGSTSPSAAELAAESQSASIEVCSATADANFLLTVPPASPQQEAVTARRHIHRLGSPANCLAGCLAGVVPFPVRLALRFRRVIMHDPGVLEHPPVRALR